MGPFTSEVEGHLSAQELNVMLVDLNLPDTDGLVLVRQARGRCLTCPVLVMTTDGFAETLDGALRAGAYHVMVKPFDLDDLARVMRQVCPAA